MNRYERLRALMERHAIDAVVLRQPANFAWSTGGADSKVDHTAPDGVADLIVGRDSQLVLTSTIEAPRMRPGRTLAEAFSDCRRFYADAGFPDERRLHHQGGLTGYASRELIATPATGHAIQPGQAFAWSPSITGAKAEETFVLTEAGPEVVAGATAAAV